MRQADSLVLELRLGRAGDRPALLLPSLSTCGYIVGFGNGWNAYPLRVHIPCTCSETARRWAAFSRLRDSPGRVFRRKATRL